MTTGEAKRNFSAELGVRIRQLRHDHGWTQSELANEIEKTVRQLGKIERGQANPSLRTLLRLQAAFQLHSIEELFGGFHSSVAADLAGRDRVNEAAS